MCKRFAILLVVVFPNLAAVKQQALAPARFRVEIEQHGKQIPAEHGVVSLERAPFDIVLYLPDKESVSLRASTSPFLYETARKGEPLGAVFMPAQSVAEAPFNKDRDITVDDATAQHAWSYDSADRDHRFNEVARVGNLYKCRRTINQLWFFGEDEQVADSTATALYLVFLSGKSSSDYSSTVESGRAALALTFKTPPRARTTPGGNAAFDVALAQRGQPVPISNGEAQLNAEPFDIVVTLASRGGIYVHAARESGVFDRARRGEPLTKTFARNQTMAIAFANRREELMLGDEASHAFWPYDGPKLHDFTSVERTGLAVRCLRKVSSIWMRGKQRTPIGSWSDPLYLVFYDGELAEPGSTADSARERQRMALKLTFLQKVSAAPLAPRRGPIRVGEVAQESKLITKVEPAYPELAKRAGVSGMVTLQVTINEQGEVCEAKVLRGHPLLDDAAISAVKKWRYSPTYLEDQPVVVITTVTVVFKTRGGGR